jgi:hypothetical protein
MYQETFNINNKELSYKRQTPKPKPKPNAWNSSYSYRNFCLTLYIYIDVCSIYIFQSVFICILIHKEFYLNVCWWNDCVSLLNREENLRTIFCQASQQRLSESRIKIENEELERDTLQLGALASNTDPWLTRITEASSWWRANIFFRTIA